MRLADATLDALTDLGYNPEYGRSKYSLLTSYYLLWLYVLRYNPEYGARPLKRVVQSELETPLARALLSQAAWDTRMGGGRLDA